MRERAREEEDGEGRDGKRRKSGDERETRSSAGRKRLRMGEEVSVGKYVNVRNNWMSVECDDGSGEMYRQSVLNCHLMCIDEKNLGAVVRKPADIFSVLF